MVSMPSYLNGQVLHASFSNHCLDLLPVLARKHPHAARLEASLVIRIILDRTSQQPCCPQCPGDHLVKDVAGHSIANHASLRCP